jgi:exodeoxyribonuclease-5
MNLSDTQMNTLDRIEEWYKLEEGPQVFKLMGYAGTGKTTLAKELIDRIDGPINFAAYTGKAASVLARKGCVGAQTVHSLIYLVKEKSKALLVDLEQNLVDMQERLKNLDEEPIAQEKREAIKDRLQKDVAEYEVRVKNERKLLGRPSFSVNPDSPIKYSSLVALDEVSMIAEEMGRDLMSFGVKILVIGDPAQLPPVFGSGFFIKGKPDVLLTEIHRQARENPLIMLAHEVRQERPIRPGSYGPNVVLEDGERLNEDVLNFDQILVGKNATRKMVNSRIREIMKHTEWHPIPGDKLICLRNNKDLGLQNGTLWNVTDVGNVDEHRIILTLIDELDNELTTEIHAGPFKGQDIPYWEKSEAQEFDFGYAITVHKSQGSQWEKVLLYDESYCFRDNKHKWLYTGLTRASERVTVLKT